jgi:hypothetical protein
MQVSELGGQELAHWFRRAAGEAAFRPADAPQELDWSLVGPVVDREKISLQWYDMEQRWTAFDRYGNNEMQDPDALTAAARCCVAAAFGHDLSDHESRTARVSR